MDFITDLCKSKGSNVNMAIVDRLTKYVHFCELSNPFNASKVAIEFMETVQNIHANLMIIVSDRDPIFIGKFGLNYFIFWVPSWLIVQVIILNLMGKLR